MCNCWAFLYFFLSRFHGINELNNCVNKEVSRVQIELPRSKEIFIHYILIGCFLGGKVATLTSRMFTTTSRSPKTSRVDHFQPGFVFIYCFGITYQGVMGVLRLFTRDLRKQGLQNMKNKITPSINEQLRLPDRTKQQRFLASL